MGESEQSRMLESILPVAFTKLVRPRCGYCSCMFGNNGALARHMFLCKELLAEEQHEEEGCYRGCGGTHLRRRSPCVRVYLMLRRLRFATDTT